MLGYVLNQSAGNFGFRHLRPAFLSRRRDQMNLIAVAAHHRFTVFFGGNIIGDDPVRPFACPLGEGVRKDVIGLGGEPDHKARTFFVMA